MYDFILDDFIWSFSRIETYERCPKCFYLNYIKKLKSVSGFFSEYGNINHDILERYLKGELFEFELSNEYVNNFDKVVKTPAPSMSNVDLRQSYYKQGLEYFNKFAGFGDRKILAVEEEHQFNVGKYKFTGKIDVETEDEIIDHKTKGKQHITRMNKNHNKDDYLTLTDGRFVTKDIFTQLYLYCIPYFNKYKKYPKFLSLNMVRINDWYSIPFDKKYLVESINWVVSEIKKIYKDTEFLKGEDVSDMWCNQVCGNRYDCPHSDKYFPTGG